MRFFRIYIVTAALLAAIIAAAAVASAQDRIMSNIRHGEPAALPAGVDVDIHTTKGDIRVRLYDDTPAHRDNFVKHVKEGYYDGVLFHRVIRDFMVQTGDPQSKNAPKGKMLGGGDPGYTLEAEIVYPLHYHKYGALAAARTGDEVNPEKRSSGSQFYIVTGKKYAPQQLDMMAARAADKARQSYFRSLVAERRDTIQKLQQAGDSEALENLRQELIRITEANVSAPEMPQNIKDAYATVGGTPFLDGDYTVFGEVLEGMDVVESIQSAATGAADRPEEDIKIISMELTESNKSKQNK